MTSIEKRAKYKVCVKENGELFKAWLGDNKEEFYHNMGNLIGHSYSSDEDFWNKWKTTLQSDKANIGALARSTNEWKNSEEYKLKADCLAIIGQVTTDPNILSQFSDQTHTLSLNNKIYKSHEGANGALIVYELDIADYNLSKSLATQMIAELCGCTIQHDEL